MQQSRDARTTLLRDCVDEGVCLTVLNQTVACQERVDKLRKAHSEKAGVIRRRSKTDYSEFQNIIQKRGCIGHCP